MSTDAAPDKKVPARPAAEVRADIERERAALEGAFEALRHDLDETIDAGRRRVTEVGKKAAVIGPAFAGAVAMAAAASLLLRRRSAKKG